MRRDWSTGESRVVSCRCQTTLQRHDTTCRGLVYVDRLST